MHDILLPKGVCLKSRDLFNFWEIYDNIWLTVKDRDNSCNGRLKGNRMCPIEWHHYQCP